MDYQDMLNELAALRTAMEAVDAHRSLELRLLKAQAAAAGQESV